MLRFEPIAIIGQGCALPGSFSPEELWETVYNGKVMISSPSDEYWRISMERIIAKRHDIGFFENACTDKGGYLLGFESFFNPDDYMLDSELITELDPLFKWSLYAANQALEEAGYIKKEVNKKTGVILGNLSYPTDSFSRLFEQIYMRKFFPSIKNSEKKVHPINRFMSGLPALFIKKGLGLGGDAFCLDAACSSSLYAIKLACDKLINRSEDMVLAGGVNAADSLFLHVGFTALKAMSPTGRSRPFNNNADGLIPAEGAAFLLLKRHSDAVRDKDKIAGVIRGIGLSNDGRTGGFLLPSSEGQIRCMKRAFSVAGIDPKDVSLVECHATGTQVGDAVEIQSMAEVFSECKNIVISSLKANLGHLITTSGAAGLIKILGCMKNGIKPHTPNAFPLSKKIEFSAFKVLKFPESWETDKKKKIACLSGFGFGGNNAHIIIEEWNNKKITPLPPKKLPLRDIAIVGVGIRINQIENVPEFLDFLLTGNLPEKQSIERLSFKTDELAAPPTDLEQTLGQQLIVLDVVKEALSFMDTLHPENMGVFIGMGTDSEVNRYGLRWRLKDLMQKRGINADESWLLKAQKSIVKSLEAPGVIGNMPNIIANRINSRYDFRGPGFTVSCEELSGVKAFEIAVDAIRKNEIGTAIVGAVDLCKEKVHELATEKIIGSEYAKGSDAAVILILKDYERAKKDKNSILAVLDESSDNNALRIHNKENIITPLLGHSHAASGLLHITAGVLLLAHRGTPYSIKKNNNPIIPDKKWLKVKIENRSFTGDSSITMLRSDKETGKINFSLRQSPNIYTYAANDRNELYKRIRDDVQTKEGTCKLAFIATSFEKENLRDNVCKLFENKDIQEGWNNKNIFFRETPIKGGLAFVFTGLAAAYQDMGKELLTGFPNLVDALNNRVKDHTKIADWIYQKNSPQSHHILLKQSCEFSFISQIHAELSFKILSLKPEAVLGLSSGETNSMFALGVWEDMDGFFNDIVQSKLYTEALAEEFKAVKKYWGEDDDFKVEWGNFILFEPVENVKKILKKEQRVYLTIINTKNNCFIAGDKNACMRIIQKIGAEKAIPVKHDIAVHCPVVKPSEKKWRECYTRPSKIIPDIKFYSSYLGGSYRTTKKNVAEALTGQVLTTIDFPKIVNKAWKNGIRIFLEHGPRNSLSISIDEILKNKPHLAVPLDIIGTSGFLQVFRAATELWCSGVKVNLDNLKTIYSDKKKITDEPIFEFAVRMPKILLPQLSYGFPKLMELPPDRAPINTPINTMNESDFSKNNSSLSAPLNILADAHKNVALIQRHYINNQLKAHNNYISFLNKTMEAVLVGHTPYSKIPKKILKQHVADVTDAKNDIKQKKYPGPSFNREQLKILASGKISSVFGPLFEKQDKYDIQVRMPEPPLLLCDKILGIKGEPGSLKIGTIWTETNVKEDSWYLHNGRMPAGIFIESGQADLLLISWLGIDFYNKGERAYRLLGCELVLHKTLPKPGDTLKYEIHVDGHAKQGDVRIFFFHYNCYTNDELIISVKNGQAGFFTKKELSESGGVIWSPDSCKYAKISKLDIPKNHTQKKNFSKEEVKSYANGDMVACFGQEFIWTQTHVRTPQSQRGYQNFIQSITEFDIKGGPAKRGYLKSESLISEDDWYFKGHFKNDPCMPGTLMAEACLQMMTFYMVGLGFSIYKDGWRFELVPEVQYKFICRGQVIPSTKKLIYEIFIDEIISEPYPTIYAHVLCKADGIKAFLCEKLGLQMVPDWPLTSMPDLLPDKKSLNPTAEYKGFKFDYHSLINCALGRPSLAFGESFSHYGEIIKFPRLPSPPYHLISRISELHAKIGQIKNNPWIKVEYDIPKDAWYFIENGKKSMPYCILMEIGLQPCGWMSIFLLRDDIAGKEFLFRNLDGTAVQHREITPEDKTISTKIILTAVFKHNNIIIVNFNVECSIEQVPVMNMKSSFGLFTQQDMKNQKGFPITDDVRKNLNIPKNLNIELTSYPEKYFKGSSARLPASKLLMLNRITSYLQKGGKKGLGFIRAEKDVKANDWFFKAHFFQDPVQPGSLGVEAFIQLIQFYMLHNELHKDMNNPVFEPVMIGSQTEWHYRGQITPDKKLVIIDVEILEKGNDKKGRFVIAEAHLWVDGLKLYRVPKIGMRLIEGTPLQKIKKEYEWMMHIDENKWVKDHKPTYTIPSLPLTFEMDMIARTIDLFPDKKLVSVDKIESIRWITFDHDSIKGKIIVEKTSDDLAKAELKLYKEKLGIYETCATGIFRFADQYDSQKVQKIDTLQNGVDAGNPYEDGRIFHGLTLQLMNNWILGSNGANCKVQSKSRGCPVGLLHPGLLDATIHCIPHDNFSLWDSKISNDSIAYPITIKNFRIYGEFLRTGMVDVEARFVKLDSGYFPTTNIWIKNEAGLLASFTLVEILLPKGPLGMAEPLDRKDFFLRNRYVKGISLTCLGEQNNTLALNEIKNSDWLPGTISKIYGINEKLPLPEVAKQIALKESAAGTLLIHPSNILVRDENGLCENTPFNEFRLTSQKSEEKIIVDSIGPSPLNWETIGKRLIEKRGFKPSFIIDVTLSLMKQFVRRVIIQTPLSLKQLQQTPVLYIGNHTTQVEAFLFIIIIMSFNSINAKGIIANFKHKKGWFEKFIELGHEKYSKIFPVDLLLLDQMNPVEMLRQMKKILVDQKNYLSSVLVHTEEPRKMKHGKKIIKLLPFIIDLSIKQKLPIVPINFYSGLPFKKSSSQFEFPIGNHIQDYYIGKPISPSELEKFPFAQQQKKILDSINNLCSRDHETLIDCNREFELSVNKRIKEASISKVQAVIIELLFRLPNLSNETKEIVDKILYHNNELDKLDKKSFLYRILSSFDSIK